MFSYSTCVNHIHISVLCAAVLLSLAVRMQMMIRAVFFSVTLLLTVVNVSNSYVIMPSLFCIIVKYM